MVLCTLLDHAIAVRILFIMNIKNKNKRITYVITHCNKYSAIQQV